MPSQPGIVTAVCSHATHGLAKPQQSLIHLVANLGIQTDAHCGATVQHRYFAKRDPTPPNLRQVHVIQAELHSELLGRGFNVGPGAMGENITTSGLDLLALPPGARLRLGPAAIITVTGLRDPCRLLNRHQPGLMAAVTARAQNGVAFFRAAIMATVTVGGTVRPGAPVVVELPPPPHGVLGVV